MTASVALDAALFTELASAAERESSGRLACHLIDLRDNAAFDYQGDIIRPAASVIKVPILIDLYARHQTGEIDLDERVAVQDKDIVGGAGVLFELHRGLELTLRDLGILMTVISDNVASNLLIERLGMDRINDRIRLIGMPNTILGRKFMIDPNALHAKNFTTAHDMAICMARLHAGQLLDPVHSAEVIDILKRQQYREKIPLLLPETVPVAHKTGEISGTRHDVALIYLPQFAYALGCLTWDLADVLAGDRAIATLSKRLYDVLAN
jgi:beta-lactamase class A